MSWSSYIKKSTGCIPSSRKSTSEPALNRACSGSGFTLIESLVAISIVTVVVAAVMAAVQGSIKSGIIAEDRITAFYLAQEATEYVKNEIANNIIQGDDWLSGFDNCDGAIGSTDDWCMVDVYKPDPGSDGVVGCGANSDDCDFIKRDSGDGRYNYDEGDKTRFRRSVQMEEIRLENASPCVDRGASGTKPCQSVLIKVEVAWSKGREQFKIIVNDYAYRWRDN